MDIDDDILIEMALADINLMEGYESIPLINHLDLFDERIKYKLLNEDRFILRLLSSFPDSSFDVSICELKQYYSKINYILKRSKKFILKAIARCDLVYLCLDNDIRNDMEFISKMLIYNPSMLKILDIKYQRDINFIVHIIKNMNNNYNSIYNLLMYYKVGDILKIRDKFINNKDLYDLIDEILVIKQRDEYLELDIPF